jgi:hypothetical protein
MRGLLGCVAVDATAVKIVKVSSTAAINGKLLILVDYVLVYHGMKNTLRRLWNDHSINTSDAWLVPKLDTRVLIGSL